MAKENRHRVQLTFSDDELRSVDAMCEAYSKWLPRGTCLRNILLDMANNTGTFRDLGSRVMSSTPEHSRTPQNIPPLGDARAGVRSQREEEKKTEREKQPTKTQLLREAAQRVGKLAIDEMNRIRSQHLPKKRGFGLPPYLKEIRTILANGHTAEDLLTVVRWRADEAIRTDDWQWFTPSTLFKPTLFAKKLDEANAGVVRGRSSSGSQPGGQIDLNDLFEFKEDVDRMNAEQRRREGRDG